MKKLLFLAAALSAACAASAQGYYTDAYLRAEGAEEPLV